ncbi:MAG: aspartyl protease family protein [Sphingomonadaceae bacterium]
MPSSLLLAPLLPVAAVLPVLAGQQAVTPMSETDVVLVSDDRHDRMTVPVRIGANGPYRFLIDTGAQNTVLSTALAGKLALKAQGKANLIGVAGVSKVDTVMLEEIGLGQRSFYSVLAPLLPEQAIGAEGILGLDSLQGQRVQIDFRAGTMAVDDARALGGNRGYEIVVTARRKSGQLIMTDATIEGVRVSVVIDTGAEYSIGNRVLQKALAKRTLNGTMVLKSVTGQTITAELGLADDLRIQEMNFGNVVIAYADAPPFKALGLDGRPALFLGMRDMRALNRIAIDFATRRIYFDLPTDAYR